MNTSRKIGLAVSLQMGFLMGTVFTLIAMLRQGSINWAGLILSILLSMAISAIWGSIISIRKISDWVIGKWKIDPEKQKMLCRIIEAIVGSVVYTPLLCTVFLLINVGFHNPMFFKIWILELLLDLVIAFFLSLVFSPLIMKIALRAAVPTKKAKND